MRRREVESSLTSEQHCARAMVKKSKVGSRGSSFVVLLAVQVKRSIIRRMEALIPGCAIQCRFSIFLLEETGTGRSTPLE